MRSHFHGGLKALHSKKKKQRAKDNDKNNFLDFCIINCNVSDKLYCSIIFYVFLSYTLSTVL